MNRIFTSGNYLIIEEDGTPYEYAAAKTVYTRRLNPDDTFTIVENGVDRTAGGRKNIATQDVIDGVWFEEDGLTPFTVATLTTFLRNNTGNFNKAGSFQSLTDVPAYATNGGKTVRVKVSEDGLEYVDAEKTITAPLEALSTVTLPQVTRENYLLGTVEFFVYVTINPTQILTPTQPSTGEPVIGNLGANMVNNNLGDICYNNFGAASGYDLPFYTFDFGAPIANIDRFIINWWQFVYHS